MVRFLGDMLIFGGVRGLLIKESLRRDHGGLIAPY